MKPGFIICPECKGNGFVRVPYEEAREEQHGKCENCNSQGEIETENEEYLKEIQKKL